MTWGAGSPIARMNPPRVLAPTAGAPSTRLHAPARETTGTWFGGSGVPVVSPTIEKAVALDATRGRTPSGDAAAFSPSTGGRRVLPVPAGHRPDDRVASSTPPLVLEAGSHTGRLEPEHTFPGARAHLLARGSRRQTFNRPGAVHRRPQVCPGQELCASGPVDPLCGGPTGP